MSAARGERRHKRGGHGARLGSIVQMAWVQDESLVEEAKTATHDGVIAQAGERRRSGVTWRILHGTEALNVLAMPALQPTDPEIVEGVADWPDGFLVLAVVAVARLA